MKKIARSRFELLSQGPEPRMIDLYTIGLRASIFLLLIVYNYDLFWDVRLTFTSEWFVRVTYGIYMVIFFL